MVIFLLILNGLTQPASAAIDRAKQAGFLPHKALYDIQLSSKKSSAAISNITGKMRYEWNSSCDAWVSNHRFNMTYDYPQTPPIHMTSDLSAYETFDGKEFNFTVQRKRDGDLFEEIRGRANNDKAAYSIPKGLSLELPKGTLFPISHTLSVLKEIKSGNKFYKATIFDGSDLEGAADISSIILSENTDYITETRDIDKNLISSKSWNIRLAFFPLNNVEITSDYEMSIIFHENGIISSMNVDYGDFSVTHKLIALEPLEYGCLSGINKL